MKTLEQRLEDLHVKKLGLFPREIAHVMETDYGIQMSWQAINAWLVYNGYQTRAVRLDAEGSTAVFGRDKYYGFHKVPFEVENAGWAVFYGDTDDACWHPDICELIVEDN